VQCFCSGFSDDYGSYDDKPSLFSVGFETHEEIPYVPGYLFGHSMPFVFSCTAAVAVLL